MDEKLVVLEKVNPVQTEMESTVPQTVETVGAPNEEAPNVESPIKRT